MPQNKSDETDKNVTSLVANKKTNNPGKVLFLFAFSLYNIMSLTYTKFE